jgi:hypothetical protein
MLNQAGSRRPPRETVSRKADSGVAHLRDKSDDREALALPESGHVPWD